MDFHLLQKEMEKLALFLNDKNLNIYTPRLDGHGTTPEDLKNKNLARLVQLYFKNNYPLTSLKLKKYLL